MEKIQSISTIYAAHVINEQQLLEAIDTNLQGTDMGAAITSSVRDGVFLCKLINKAAPGTIDERVLNTNARVNTQEARENIRCEHVVRTFIFFNGGKYQSLLGFC